MTNLVLALLETERPLSLREIGAAVAGYPPAHGALRQAFERDKRALRDGGIPISTERLESEEQVGYRIDPDEYYLPDLGLEEEEMEALAFALAAVRLEGGMGGGLGRKLGAPGLDGFAPIAVLPSLPALGPLEQAVRTRARVAFTYNHKRRDVAGFALVFKEGSWYLVGDDASVGATAERRTFRVDRIEGDIEASEPGAYELPADFDAAEALAFPPVGRGDAATTEVRFRVAPRSAAGVVAQLGGAAKLARRPDGWTAVTVAVADEGAFCSYLLGLGEDAVVEAPKSLRDRMVTELTARLGERAKSRSPR